VRPQIPVTALSKACVCGRSLAGTAGSNAAGGMVVSCVLLSGRGLCDGPIFRPGESRHVCVWVCATMIRCNSDPLHVTLKRYKEVRIRRKGRKSSAYALGRRI
jgi:hypothetical protein